MVRLGGKFLYMIGPTPGDENLKAQKEDEFWQKMQKEYRAKVFFDLPTSGMQQDKISSMPLTADQSRRMKDGSYTMFFMVGYREEDSKKIIAAFCGTTNLEGNLTLCSRHNFP